MREFNTYLPIDTFNPVNRNHKLARSLQHWWLGFYPSITGRTWFDLMNLSQPTFTGMSSNTVGFKNQTRISGFRSLYCNSASTYGKATVVGPRGGQVTVMCWAYFDGAFGFPNQTCLLGSAGSTPSVGGIGAGNTLTLVPGQFGWWDGAFVRSFFTTTPSVNTWVHMAGTINGGAGIYYQNGVIKNSASPGFGIQTGSSFLWFGSNDTSNSLKGYLTDIRYYNRALSATEIQDAYINSLQGYPNLLNRVNLVERIQYNQYFTCDVGDFHLPFYVQVLER